MRWVLIIGGLAILVIAGFFVLSSTKSNVKPQITPAPQIEQSEIKPVDIKASFAIFTNGTFRVFTAPMYHNLSPDVFIDSSNPNIVNIKKPGITWDGFFKTLPMKLTRDCLITGTGQNFCNNSSQTLKFYINGKQDQNALEQTINDGDQLLISYGNEDDAQIKKQLEQIPSPN